MSIIRYIALFFTTPAYLLDLKQLLLDTGSRRLGETGKDSFFSIGLPLTHPDVLVTKKWKSNHLGNALEIT